MPEKKKFEVKIAGFTFGKKTFIFLGVVVVIFVLIGLKNSAEKKKQAEEAAREADLLAKQYADSLKGDTQVLDFHDQMQQELVRQYGEPPEGFEWDYAGNLVSLGGSDVDTCEDVVYMFLRALSILDFSTAERYSTNSQIISTYQNYYSDISNQLSDYYSNFLRKQLKASITSLEVVEMKDTAVFADGTEYITLVIKVLDLTDKDFWEKDRNSIFETLRVYRETESDTVKLNQYVYDYVSGKYEDGTIGKREVTIELVATKQNGGGWTVSGDGELCSVLEYENGVDVAAYILDEFNSWYQEVLTKEQLESIQNKLKGAE